MGFFHLWEIITSAEVHWLCQRNTTFTWTAETVRSMETEDISLQELSVWHPSALQNLIQLLEFFSPV